MAGDVQSYLDAAPLRTSRVDGIRHRKRRWAALLAILIAHLASLHWAMKHVVELRNREPVNPIEVALIDRPVPQPVPELQKAPPAPHRPGGIRAENTAPSPTVEPAPSVPSTPSVTLFNSDGSLRVPREAKPQRGLPEPDILKGRELMGRGLDCEAPDALGSSESLGESVARKYLSWIGLYNPYSAQHRAELVEERKERCKRWRGQT